MKDFLKKLTSRKFIVTAITTITGIITMIIGENEIVNTVSSALMIIVPTVVYCIIEGVIDSKNVKNITDTVVDTAKKLGADDKIVDTIEKVGEVGEILTEINDKE